MTHEKKITSKVIKKLLSNQGTLLYIMQSYTAKGYVL